MKHEKLPIPVYLKDYIQSLWILECEFHDATPKTFVTVADGSPGLIFQHPAKGKFFRDKKNLPDAFVYGQTIKYNELQFTGQFSTIGITFFPHALKTIFELDASELTESCVDLNLLTIASNLQLSDNLLHAATTQEQVKVILDFLWNRVQKNKQYTDWQTEQALLSIRLSNGNIPLKIIMKDIGLSERSIERRFKETVGISPKLFSKICRFQASLRQLKNNDYSKLSDIAFDNAYADQSHFIRTFKEFTGFSPNQYQQQSSEVVENFSAVTS